MLSGMSWMHITWNLLVMQRREFLKIKYVHMQFGLNSKLHHDTDLNWSKLIQDPYRYKQCGLLTYSLYIKLLLDY